MVDTSAQDDVDNIDEKMKRMITMVGDNIVTPAATASSVTPALIPVSTPLLLLSMVPLFFIAYASWYMELNLESPVLVGMIRTFVQLSVLSLILEPIFVRGKDWWWLVIGYTIFMIVLAAYESASRAKYYFRGMFWFVLAVLSGNVVLVSLFAFGIVLQPDPLWEPQYVIPIVGMLLGNCINGIALSLNAMLTSLVESTNEIELFQSFGATNFEASRRLLVDSIRTGTMPQLNGMAIIGVISIPGMMTGQILGGAPVKEAARYQILITYFIAICSFGSTLTQSLLTLQFLFDANCTLRTDRLIRRVQKPSLLAHIRSMFGSSPPQSHSNRPESSDENALSGPSHIGTELSVEVLSTALSSGETSCRNSTILKLTRLSRSILRANNDLTEQEDLNDFESESAPLTASRRFLFQDINLDLKAGEIALVTGPSGVGKTTLLRCLAGLDAPDGGLAHLNGIGRSSGQYKDMTVWRQDVRYVTQSKVDIPGSPHDFLRRIESFQVWSRYPSERTNCERKEAMLHTLRARTIELVQSWGMGSSSIDSEWSSLSGGEAQRILLALALATRPPVLLLDEITSALDVGTKIRVEQSIVEHCRKHCSCAIWITHDVDQMERLKRNQS